MSDPKSISDRFKLLFFAFAVLASTIGVAEARIFTISGCFSTDHTTYHPFKTGILVVDTVTGTPTSLNVTIDGFKWSTPPYQLSVSNVLPGVVELYTGAGNNFITLGLITKPTVQSLTGLRSATFSDVLAGPSYMETPNYVNLRGAIRPYTVGRPPPSITPLNGCF